jgi:hypothetical protein
VSANDTEQLVDNLIKIFCLLHSRDSFLKAYKYYLSNRLLEKSFENKDNEKLFLSKLKKECGISTISKLESMLSDINLTEA